MYPKSISMENPSFPSVSKYSICTVFPTLFPCSHNSIYINPGRLVKEVVIVGYNRNYGSVYLVFIWGFYKIWVGYYFTPCPSSLMATALMVVHLKTSPFGALHLFHWSLDISWIMESTFASPFLLFILMPEVYSMVPDFPGTGSERPWYSKS